MYSLNCRTASKYPVSELYEPSGMADTKIPTDVHERSAELSSPLFLILPSTRMAGARYVLRLVARTVGRAAGTIVSSS